MQCIGFEPFVRPDSRLLILGSFPSVKSRQEGFYYGNKQNKFWRILAQKFCAPVPQTIQEKQTLLSSCRIALWDMVTACEIVGSMDKDVKDPVVADIPALLSDYPIRKILTNGALARKLLLHHFPQLQNMTVALPSTSPANARLDVSLWLDALDLP